MPNKRAGYNTEQRRLVLEAMGSCADRYQTVDEVFESLRANGHAIGRTTVYRALEKLAADGSVSKVSGTRGASAGYRLVGENDPSGQLFCLKCGRAFPLDCSMLESFADHVRAHHGFVIDQRRTVLCGICEMCRRAAGEAPERDAEHVEHTVSEDAESK